ncbi:MAG: hypothetical protein L0H37_07380, partial [Nitrosospira sp.]|nr:hypothetical protein [Nitrosospira sp.]
RMADYVAWAEAGTRAMGFAPGAFTKTYIENQEQGVGDGLESSAAGMALLKLLESRNSWNGSANDLLEALSDHVEEDVRRSKAWPKTPRGMRSVIARLTPALRSNGIGVEYTRTGARGRTITLSHIENDTDSSNNEADFPSSSEEPVHKEPALSVSKLPVDTTEDSFLDGDGGFTV